MLPYKFKFRRILRSYVKQVGDFNTVLDVACADGKLRSFFDGKIYTGVDISMEAIERAKALYPDDVFVCSPLHGSNFAKLGKFDLVICTHTIAHLKEKDKVSAIFQILARVTPKSRIVLQLTTKDWILVKGAIIETCEIVRLNHYRGLSSKTLEKFGMFHYSRFGFYLSWFCSFMEFGHEEVLVLLAPKA